MVLSVSLDLPFAHSRFCETEGLEDVIPLSDFRTREFGDRYGVRIVDGPLKGLLARLVSAARRKGAAVQEGVSDHGEFVAGEGFAVYGEGEAVLGQAGRVDAGYPCLRAPPGDA